MKIQLIQGQFDSKDALALITEMIQMKIKYHENKIVKELCEEDIKYRESKIKTLQMQLFKLREVVNSNNEGLKIESVIKIETNVSRNKLVFDSTAFFNN